MPHSTSKPKSAGGEKIFCHYCGQGFSRDEHLERHVLTHINVRPFQCRECKVRFKRKDLLRRHYQCIHSSPGRNDDNEGHDTRLAKPGAGRIPIACVNCAQSKTKCDNLMPCARCKKKGIPCERRKFRRASVRGISEKTAMSHVGQVELGGDEDATNSDEFHRSEKNTTSPTTPEEPNSPAAASENDEAFNANISRTELNFSIANVTEPDLNEPDHFHDRSLTFEVNMQQPFYPDIDLFLNEDYAFSNHLDYETFLLCADSSTPSKAIPISGCSPTPQHLQTPSQSASTQATARLSTTNKCDQWPQFRCNPALKAEDGLAFQSLLDLRVLERAEFWSLCNSQSTTPLSLDSAEASLRIQQCGLSPRDKLFAVTQQIWLFAKEQLLCAPSTEQEDIGANDWMDGIALLPPTEIMHGFLEKYLFHENHQFHLLPSQEFITLASFLETGNQLLSGVLALLIIAQVTRSAPVSEVHALSNCLVEVCRISLQDAEWDLGADLLEASLSLVQLLQWSGEAGHMNSVPDLWEQQAKHIQRHLRIRDPIDETLEAFRNTFPDTDIKRAKSLSRVLFCWMAVDLELSLFHDVPPRLALQDFTSCNISPLSETSNFTSLPALFEAFTEGQLANQTCITAPTLRLLLHPLQCLSAHLHQCLATFDSIQDAGKGPNSTIGLASKAFIDELNALLEQWHELCLSATAASGMCPTSRISLVLYHMMILNNLASFPEIERLVREDVTGGDTTRCQTLPWMRKDAANTKALLLFHCGQCILHLRTLSSTARPLWWPAALYRVALVLSQCIISNSLPFASGLRFKSTLDSPRSPNSSLVVLDEDYVTSAPGRDVALQRFLTRLQGTPVLTWLDGSTMLLSSTINVLDYCIKMLDSHIVSDPSAFASGIHVKMGALRSRWESQSYTG